MTRLAVFLATAGYAGYFPIAPGTVGSAVGLLVYALVWWTQSPALEVALILVLFAAGVWAGTIAEQYFGGIDPGPIVLDEVVGMLITLLFIPVGLSGVVAGFFLFRVFDVIKPFPAARFEKLHGGLGVMADDAMAALYANASLRILMALFPGVDRVSPAAPLHTAEIIAVGSELLGSTKLDTNSLFLAERLGSIGIELRAKTVVGDNRREVEAHITRALERADLVILTGGLGPTDDDVTRDAVANALGLALLEDPAIVERLSQRFARRGLKMPDVNRRQALVLEGGVVLENPLGTAPGQMVEREGRVVLLLPGPPRELQPMMDAMVAGPLAVHVGRERIFRTTLFVTGRGESHVEEIVQPVYSAWLGATPPIETTILAAPGQIELHLVTRSADADAARRALDIARDQILAVIGEDTFSVDGRPMEEIVGRLLLDRGLTIAAAESCTGGLLLSRLTDVPGSSAYVLGGVVAYSNDVKIDLASVTAGLIEAHGAVSEPVAVAMAEGIRSRTGSSIGVAITGIAGPGGGTAQKPVGTVALAIVGPDGAARARTVLLFGSRGMVKFQATQAALDMVRKLLAPRVSST